ncbi:sulfite exporter TauE/SafE family protein [Flavobacterium sp. NRK1]|uniref:sulfite exporter TauE/SafE family protein n=1 Tax=Flavobacterium sp. NRK1 TaxID=2954929 RepID=UPI0020925455|nr:sulfite exporter TauE/SafE family protein [Flavobacterium sp. NRK1]MCO6149143.1 sulfite exporter TauE/SafE family protein [Flavobacterium sp. NRK1]
MVFTIILLFVAVIIAFWISAIAGGGASLIILPVLNILLPLSHIPFTLTIGTFTSSASRIAVFKKNIYWPLFFWFVPFSVPAVFLGVYFLRFLNPVYLQFFIAFFLLLNLVKFLKKKRSRETLKKQSVCSIAIIGFCAGFISGITGAVGLLFNRFYLKLGLRKEQIVATRAANEIFIHLIKLLMYLYIGLYSEKAFVLGLVIAAASVLSALTLKYILPFVTEKTFHKTGYMAMIVSGAFLMSNATSEIVQLNNVKFISETDCDKTEWGVVWNDAYFEIEHSANSIEFERSILYSDLPFSLQKEYDKIKFLFNEIKLEKVYKLGKAEHYEFYAYKNNKLCKYKFIDF